MEHLRLAGIAADHATLNHDCHVDDARNALVWHFLRTTCTDLVFLDADIGWIGPELVELLNYDADVVLGVYPKKGDDNWPVLEVSGKALQARADGLVDIPGGPTGFMRIKRHVLEKLTEANKHRSYRAQGQGDDVPPHTIIFERTYEEGRRWSGDYSFCRAWRKLGGTVFVAPEMDFAHVGEMQWTGSLADHWRERAGLYHPNLVLGLHALYDGADDAATFGRIFTGWGNPYAAQPTLLAAVHDIIKEAKGPVLETGSGVSTLVMAIAAMKAGVEVHALEHDLDYFKKTQEALKRFGIKNVTLHYAPLRAYKNGFVWYEVPESFPEAEFAVVFCDGPQQRFGRGGLFNLLGDQIRKAHVIMDDAYESQLGPIREWATRERRNISVLSGADHRDFAVSAAA